MPEGALLIGEPGDTPRAASSAMGWPPDQFGLGFVIARTDDGKMMRVEQLHGQCYATKIKDNV